MKPCIFIFKVPDKNGKFIFTEDELKEVLEKVYNDAYEAGFKACGGWWTYTTTGTITTSPPTYTTTTPNDVPNPYQVTCSEAMNAVGD